MNSIVPHERYLEIIVWLSYIYYGQCSPPGSIWGKAGGYSLGRVCDHGFFCFVFYYHIKYWRHTGPGENTKLKYVFAMQQGYMRFLGFVLVVFHGCSIMIILILYILTLVYIIVSAFCQQNSEIKGIHLYETSGKWSSAVTIIIILALLFVIDTRFWLSLKQIQASVWSEDKKAILLSE